MIARKLSRSIIMLLVLSAPQLGTAESPNMQTTDSCSAIVTGAGASVTSYCIGITKDALEHLSDITAASRGRKLFVSEAWLSPTPLFGRPRGDKKGLNEQVYLSVRATNISSSLIVLTAAKWEIVQARNLSKGGGSYGYKNLLWPALSVNKPIKIKPGAQVEIKLGEGLELHGMASRMHRNHDLDNAYVVPEIKPARINGDIYVNWFAEQMGLLYGMKSNLRITLYEGDYKPIASLSLPLAQGVDFFYHGEAVDQRGRVQYAPRLAYDAFLGQYLEMREKMEPGFRINQPPTTLIEVTPDPTVWGKQRYRSLGVQEHPEE